MPLLTGRHTQTNAYACTSPDCWRRRNAVRAHVQGSCMQPLVWVRGCSDKTRSVLVNDSSRSSLLSRRGRLCAEHDVRVREKRVWRRQQRSPDFCVSVFALQADGDAFASHPLQKQTTTTTKGGVETGRTEAVEGDVTSPSRRRCDRVQATVSTRGVFPSSPSRRRRPGCFIMAIFLARWHSRWRLPARTPPRMPMGACRRMAATTSSGTFAPLVSKSPRGFASWRYSGTDCRPHRRLADVYALLEERLPVAPLCPNDALDTLLCLVPTDIHHNGVVDHLVRIVSGNACCIDPSLCLAVMERLLVPALPSWLRGSAVVTDSSSDGDDLPGAEISDAALLIALEPLGRVLSRCVVVHVRLWLGESGHVTDSLCRLRDWHTLRTGPFCRRSPHDSGEGDDSSSSFLLRGAAVLMSFTAQRQFWDCSGSARGAVMNSCTKQHLGRRESNDRWHACSLIAVAYPVVRYLYSAQSQANERERLAARTGIRASVPTAGTLQPSRSCGGAASGDRCVFDPSRWDTVRSLGQQCWWWSTVVCRAIPAIPSAAGRAFAVHSLVDVVHELHRTLASCVVPCGSPLLWACSEHPPQLPSPETLQQCLAMLEWLLVDSVPVLRDRSDADASWLSPADLKTSVQSSRPSAWTAELRRGWRHLGADFARLSAAALEGMVNGSCTASDACGRRAAAGDAAGKRDFAVPRYASPPLGLSLTGARACSYLVREMANVGYRLALQWAAVVTPLTTAVAMSALVEGTLDAQLRCCTFQRPGFLDKCQRQQQEQGRASPACELDVVLRLLHAIRSVRPALSSAASTISSGSSSAAELVFVEETTWCKLACLVNLVRCHPVDRAERSQGRAGTVGAMHEHQKFVQLHEQRLLHCGLVHVLACAAISTSEAASCGTVGAAMTEGVVALGHCGTSPQSSAHTPPHALPESSAEFLCALLKCWCTWTMDWPLQLYATWLQELESAAAVVATRAGAGAKGADERESTGGTSFSTRATAAHAEAAMAVPNFPFRGVADDPCDQACRSMHRRLCSLLTEAWAATMDTRHDRDPLDVCACWYAFSAVSRPLCCPSATGASLTARAGMLSPTCCASSHLSQQRSCVYESPREDKLREQLTLMTAASEDRFCRMCESWFKQLRDLPNTRVMGSILQLMEQRPMPLHRPSVQRQKCDVPAFCWCPISLPSIVSHLALRVLYRSRPEGMAGTTPAILDGNGVASELPRVSDSFVAMVHAALLTPATAELAAFQLSVVCRYAEWCQSAGVHIGWCACAVQAHRTAGGAGVSYVSCMPVDDLVGPASGTTGMPWWVLTVDGMGVRERRQGGVSVTTILFLWEHGAAAATGMEASRFFGPHACHESGCASAIRPLMPPRPGTTGDSALAELSEASPNEMKLDTLGAPPKATAELDDEVGGCNGFSDEHRSMRQSIVEWGHRYALRLVLFEVGEGQWHRSRGAALARRSQQQLARRALCHPWRQRRRTLAAIHEGSVEEDAKSVAGARLNYAAPAYRSAVSGLGITPRFVWHSDAYQPLVQLVAGSAACMVDQLAAEVLAFACTTAAHGEASNSKVKADEPRTAGHAVAGALVTNLFKAEHPECWTARLTAHLWGELCRSLAQATVAQPSRTFPYAHGTSFHGSRHRPSPTPVVRCSLGQHPQSRGLASSDPVSRLEQLLCGLGLVAASENPLVYHAPGGVVLTEGVAEESHALLASLLLSPELVCASSIVAHFANAVLWQKCWASLTTASSAAAHHNGGGMPGSLGGLGDVTAQLDELVAFRVILRCFEQVQRLVHELVEYLCCVFVPAVQADHDAACLTATPVEAMRRLACTFSSSASRSIASPTTHLEHVATAQCTRRDVRNLRGHFRFSSATVRAFEVLCLGRCGDERRAPRVWQQWTRELLRSDRVLREHPLLRSTSQWCS
ncbi:conserved hypothetical protein [Leishmania major strain Friedlin]|uniref:Uncharacterized protein n=1 Tax=Leishmania major TaxID=5664 RepID=Q4Q998_LEIMA|nr:conserved hypothetical protein [Leishmania major strain Friedlin]CAG9576416.1 hypothetical_protein_-_conserved [Leishmania major strain Friedlin]CAJ05007.1 conserved hypothetical protein [Leishmania major strain Friedlin]|eukprot:XP_001684100.1 conserved hypothetical protein [Leishmania major strain Friedlin]